MKNHYNTGILNPNFKTGETLKSHFCADCGKEIVNYTSKKCKSCGHKKPKLKCIDCKKELSTRGTKDYKPERCIKCDSKLRSKRVSGKNNGMFDKINKLNGNYKHGGYSDNKKKCPDCGTEINYNNNYCILHATKGNKNGRWIDGRSYEEYPVEFSIKLREQIRQRDHNKCRNCGMAKEEHFKKYGRNLEVHHKDKNKKHNKVNNLILLCKPCHERITLGGKKRG